MPYAFTVPFNFRNFITFNLHRFALQVSPTRHQMQYHHIIAVVNGGNIVVGFGNKPAIDFYNQKLERKILQFQQVSDCPDFVFIKYFNVIIENDFHRDSEIGCTNIRDFYRFCNSITHRFCIIAKK